MSNSVSYVFDVPGREFNQLLDSKFCANDADLDELFETGSLWDGRLNNSQLDFSVELTGDVTVVWLTIRYATYISEPTVKEAVSQWEHAVKARIDPKSGVCIDEFLLKEWETERGEDWFRGSDAFSAFQRWINDRPQESWHPI